MAVKYTNISYVHEMPLRVQILVQWNLPVTTTSMINFITFDLFSNVF